MHEPTTEGLRGQLEKREGVSLISQPHESGSALEGWVGAPDRGIQEHAEDLGFPRHPNEEDAFCSIDSF